MGMVAKDKNIVFIGAGNMAQCLIQGLLKNSFNPTRLWATDPKIEHLTDLNQELGVHTTPDNLSAAAQADVLIFAVKPQMLKEVVLECAGVIRANKPLLISIAAGVRISTMEQWLQTDAVSIIRCMPNTPALIGHGMMALLANKRTQEIQQQLAENIFKVAGKLIWLEDEAQIDVVAALSGSGPAYFFYVMEALQEAAISLGLPPDMAKTLIMQTALGSAQMVLSTERSIQDLRLQVTSPAGGTEQAIKVLDEQAIKAIFNKAITAAHQRYIEIGEKFK